MASNPTPAVKYVAAEMIRLHSSHYNEGEVIPQKAIDKMDPDTLKADLKRGIIKRVEEGAEKPVKEEPLQLPTPKEWLAAGYGRDLAEPEQKKAYGEHMEILRAEAKAKGRKVIEPK